MGPPRSCPPMKYIASSYVTVIRSDHNRYVCSVPSLPQKEATQEWSHRDGCDLCPYVAILVAHSLHRTMCNK
ncbi:MAG: hypothetical protein FRX49_03494 [Trebouxia sp. A1-2]|nr:MAG: hypothetical protein FRX49_03494 [Trebouxia sp. A1-2]